MAVPEQGVWTYTDAAASRGEGTLEVLAAILLWANDYSLYV